MGHGLPGEPGTVEQLQAQRDLVGRYVVSLDKENDRLRTANAALLEALEAMFRDVDELLVQVGEISGLQHVLDAVGKDMQMAEAAIAQAKEAEHGA